jgi:hypothetical protein
MRVLSADAGWHKPREVITGEQLVQLTSVMLALVLADITNGRTLLGKVHLKHLLYVVLHVSHADYKRALYLRAPERAAIERSEAQLSDFPPHAKRERATPFTLLRAVA